MKDSTLPLLCPESCFRRFINYLIPDMASSEFLRIAVSFGAAIDQIPVTSAVVIRTTKTQPGTSPLLLPVITFIDFNAAFSMIREERSRLRSFTRNICTPTENLSNKLIEFSFIDFDIFISISTCEPWTYPNTFCFYNLFYNFFHNLSHSCALLTLLTS